MNDQDRDLILALAAGTLTHREAVQARAYIASDPELLSSLTEQTLARDLLASAERVSMTQEERTALRRDLSTALNLEAAPRPMPRGSRPASRWWQPVLGIATAAVVVTAIIVLPGTFSATDSSDVEEVALATVPTSADGEVTTTLAAGSSAADSPESEDAAGGLEPEPPATTEVLAFAETDGADLLSATEGKTDPDSITEALVEEEAPVTRSLLDLSAVDACLESLGEQLPDGDKVVLGLEERDDGIVVFLGIDNGAGVESVITVTLSSCELIDIDP